ncbi:hypothetical protein TNCV_4950661 [Trichonephila clavipes]|nr:hypothetical protein TNCV_4950661 [Trichonephila clavipes]
MFRVLLGLFSKSISEDLIIFFSHHTSGVQCVTSIHSEALIISGSDSGVVVVSRLCSGQVIHKLENHRGVISSVAVNSGDDIFASGEETVL